MGRKTKKEFYSIKVLSFMSEIICHKLICRHYNDFLTRNFEIKKTRELVAKNTFSQFKERHRSLNQGM